MPNPFPRHTVACRTTILFTLCLSQAPIAAARAPGIAAGVPDPHADVGVVWTLGPYTWDHDGDPLEFSVHNRPVWLLIDEDTGRLRGTPTTKDVGAHEDIVLSVSDGTHTSSLPPFSITVRKPHAPVTGEDAHGSDARHDDPPTAPPPQKPALEPPLAEKPAPEAPVVDEVPPASSSSLAFLDLSAEISGAANCDPDDAFDFDFMDGNGDGLYDLFVFSHEGLDHCLYVQRRDGSGTFEYVSGEAAHYRQDKVPPRGSSRATFIDVDGDGREDITTVEADIMAALFPNETAEVGGMPRYGTKREWCSARDFCTVGDVDGDGRMDKIRGDRSVETILSGAEVVAASGPRSASGWNVVDLDGDSWPDLVDVAMGGYWRNAGGRLSWQAVAGFAPCTFGRHQDFADFDNDGDLDIACSSGAADLKNTGGSRHLLRNDGGGRFTEVIAGSGFSEVAWLPYYSSYSNSYAADFDNDGWVDYAMAGSSYRVGVQILRNVGGLKFELQGLEFASQFAGGGGKPRVDVADYDHDGWLDLLLGQEAAPSVRLYRNVTSVRHNWLGVRLRGAQHNTGGLNATVRVYRAGSEELLGSFQVMNHSDGQMRHVHAGLGAVTRVDVEIRWPHEGGTEWLRGVAANQTVHVSYRSGGSIIQQGWMPGGAVVRDR